MADLRKLDRERLAQRMPGEYEGPPSSLLPSYILGLAANRSASPEGDEVSSKELNLRRLLICLVINTVL